MRVKPTANGLFRFAHRSKDARRPDVGTLGGAALSAEDGAVGFASVMVTL
ncbi:hypothetical protein GCM10017607_26620 [Microbacterium thalassium]|nr:hypothetical protein GCM10017607_26620 [Microbacterium thalassium]